MQRLEKYIFIKKICSYSINPSMEREYAYSPPPPLSCWLLAWFGLAILIMWTLTAVLCVLLAFCFSQNTYFLFIYVIYECLPFRTVCFLTCNLFLKERSLVKIEPTVIPLLLLFGVGLWYTVRVISLWNWGVLRFHHRCYSAKVPQGRDSNPGPTPGSMAGELTT